MNKKGFLLASEVVKIVLSVISISFLIYLLFSIYYSNIQNQKFQEAKSTIERMKNIILRIDSGKILSEKMTDITPSSWNFFSFVEAERKPNSCAGESCLCVCESVSFDNILGFKNRQINECSEKGVCLVVKNLNKFKSFEIEKSSNGGTNIEILKSGKKLEVKKI